MDQIFQFGLQGVIAYGVVGVLMYFKKDLPSQVKFSFLFVIAFAVGFIPTNLGNVLLNHIKDAAGVAFGIHAFYSMSKNIAERM